MPTLTPPRPRVLFVAGQDGAASRLAAGLLERSAGELIEVSAASTRPADPADQVADLVLTEAGLDPADHPAQLLSAGALRRADRVISLSPTVDVARIPGPRYETWEITELSREALTDRVQALATDLTAVPTPRSAPWWRQRLPGLWRRVAGR